VKRFLIIFGISLLLVSLPAELFADRRGFVRTVVIDAGHGGKDPGAVGSRTQEKNITLSIALKLGDYIKQNFSDVKVIYTRDTDVFVELHRRAQIANENHADLFISIHCNSARNSSAYGSETFVMGIDRSRANLEVAKKENAAILYEEDYLETYDGYDPNSPESNIIFTLFQNEYLNRSLDLASLVQDQFRERAKRVDRGVKQEGFIVLYRATMPAILVEAGFLSNAREEAYLASAEGQDHIASAIFRAFRDYKTQQDQIAASWDQQLLAQHTETPEESGPVSPKPAVAATGPARETTENSPQIIFKVQFASTREKKPLDAPEFKDLEQVDYYFQDGLYKYTVGNVMTLEDAAVIQDQVQMAGFKDAFVVAFHNNQRISPAEALRLLNQFKTNP
jgi:N-acetylmuramoyl-L-alanine amidase